MDDANVKVDYGDFTAGYNTITALNKDLDSQKTEIESCKSNLQDEAIFMGPIADSTRDTLTELSNLVNLMTENFTVMANLLTQVGKNFKEADYNAMKFIQTTKEGEFEIIDRPIYVDNTHPQYQVDFINKVLPGALATYEKYGVLPSITLAQAAKETGWGKYTIGNNIFGVKAGSGWTGKTINAETGEQNPDGSRYRINADFRDYDSVEDSIEDHAKVLTQDRYKDVINAKDYKEAARAVKAGGYATSVDYDSSLINDYIEPYNLNQWDPK